MKSAMLEMLEMINNRSDNSLKTKFNEEEKKFWLEKEKEQIINAFGNGEYMVFVKDRLDYEAEDYQFNNSEEYYNVTFENAS